MNPSTLKYPSLAVELAFEKLLTDHIIYRKVDERCCRIKWRGEFIKTYSGKSSWRTVGHAKAAFRNHIQRTSLALEWERLITGNKNLRCYDAKMEDEFFKMILTEVEFVEV